MDPIAAFVVIGTVGVGLLIVAAGVKLVLNRRVLARAAAKELEGARESIARKYDLDVSDDLWDRLTQD